MADSKNEDFKRAETKPEKSSDIARRGDTLPTDIASFKGKRAKSAVKKRTGKFGSEYDKYKQIFLDSHTRFRQGKVERTLSQEAESFED